MAPLFRRLFGAGRSREAVPGAVPLEASAPALPSDAAWLVVGLGNPGARYAGTRHNAGFEVVARVAAAAGARFDRRAPGAEIAEATVDGVRVALARPETFMNRSGDAVVPLLAALGLGPERLLVVTDDLSLPLGALRLRPKGGHGGHNGLRSIAEALEAAAPPPHAPPTGEPPAPEAAAPEAVAAPAGRASAEYPRLRVGIGNSFAPGFQAEFVLSRFEPDERDAAEAAFGRAAEAVATVVARGVEAAMPTVNRRS